MLKKSKKLLYLCFFSLVLATFSPLSTAYAKGIENTSTTSSYDMETQVSSRKPKIDWRYKIEDGKLYRRLYNYSTQKWVGEWELCP